MTFFLNEAEQQPILPARQPATSFIPSWMEGHTARKTVMDIEDNASWNFQQTRNDIKYGSADEILAQSDIQEIAQFANEGRYPKVRMGIDPASIQSREDLENWLGSGWQAAVVDWNEANGNGMSPEELEQATIDQVQTQYEDAQNILAMRPEASVSENLMAGFASGMTDIRQAPFMLLGGGSASLMRIMGREAVINTATESALLPSQFEMAERLGIEDPNVVAQLRDAAIFGAVFGGSLEVSRRAFNAVVGRGRVPEGLPNSPEVQVAIDQMEDALATGRDPSEVQLPPELTRAPPPPARDPLVLQNPILPPAREIDADLPDVADGPDPELPSITQMIEQQENEISRLQGEAGKAASQSAPLITSLGRGRSVGPDGKVSITGGIHPDGPVGQALKAAGITSRTHPSLYSRNGRKDLDDLWAEEWEGDYPGIMDATGSRGRTDGYIDQDGLIDLIIRTAGGDQSWLQPRADVQAAEDALNDMIRERDEGPMRSPLDDFNDKVQSDDGYFVDLTAMQMAYDYNEILDVVGREFDRYISDKWPGVRLNDVERAEIVEQLSRTGGDAEFLVDRFLERELEFAKLPRTEADAFDDIPFGDNNDKFTTARSDVEAGGSGLEQQRQVGGPDEGSAPRQGRASEQTEAGEQTLVDGVDPVTSRDILEAQQNAPMRGGDAAADDGLFDVNSRTQTDMFSDPVAAADQHREVGAQLRAELEDLGEMDFTAKSEEVGREMNNSREILDYLDDMDRAADRIQLCGKMIT